MLIAVVLTLTGCATATPTPTPTLPRPGDSWTLTGTMEGMGLPFSGMDSVTVESTIEVLEETADGLSLKTRETLIHRNPDGEELRQEAEERQHPVVAQATAFGPWAGLDWEAEQEQWQQSGEELGARSIRTYRGQEELAGRTWRVVYFEWEEDLEIPDLEIQVVILRRLGYAEDYGILLLQETTTQGRRFGQEVDLHTSLALAEWKPTTP